MKVVDAETMRAMDRGAVADYAMKGIQLMENAGRAVAEVVLRELSKRGGPKRAAIVCGKGNNGGDGFVCARHLKNAGVDVALYCLAEVGDYKGDSLVNALCWQKMGNEVIRISGAGDIKKYSSSLRHAGVLVDALLGTGIIGGAKGFYGEVIEFINTLKARVISIDVPSGLNASTGEAAGPVVRADITVTMALPKLGFYLPPGPGFAGSVEVGDIGMPAGILTDEAIRWNLIAEEGVSALLSPRVFDSHKGTYGHTVILGGSTGKSGAPYMSAMAAMRAGAGLVTIGIPAGLNNIMEQKTTEAMTWPLSETDEGGLAEDAIADITKLLNGKSCVVAGPGLGISTHIKSILKKLLKESAMPMVLDADALNNLAGFLDCIKGEVSRDIVLTPHPGEAARLLGLRPSDIQADRMGAAEVLSRKTGAVVVLKGANTIIASPEGTIYINTTGGPALATAGTGDVLAGMIGGLMGQGMGGLHAAITAVYAHGLSGDNISRKRRGQRGLIATELLDVIAPVLNSLIDG